MEIFIFFCHPSSGYYGWLHMNYSSKITVFNIAKGENMTYVRCNHIYIRENVNYTALQLN